MCYDCGIGTYTPSKAPRPPYLSFRTLINLLDCLQPNRLFHPASTAVASTGPLSASPRWRHDILARDRHLV